MTGKVKTTINIPCYDKGASVYLAPFKKCTWLDIFKQQFAEKHLTYTKGKRKCVTNNALGCQLKRQMQNVIDPKGGFVSPRD